MMYLRPDRETGARDQLAERLPSSAELVTITFQLPNIAFARSNIQHSLISIPTRLSRYRRHRRTQLPPAKRPSQYGKFYYCPHLTMPLQHTKNPIVPRRHLGGRHLLFAIPHLSH